MVNLLGETNAPTKPRPTTSETLDVFVTGVPSTPPTPKTSSQIFVGEPKTTPKPTPTPTPIIPQPTPTPKDSGYGAYEMIEDETCPEGFSKNYNRQGELECLPNYNDKPADCGSPTMCTEDEDFVDCKCQKKTPSTNTPTQVTKNLKPLIYGVGIIVGIIIISKLLKSN
jgi:hypothetical protein